MTERVPRGLKRSGRRLWREVTARLALDEHERSLFLQACRTADLLDALHTEVERDGVMLEGKAHPALVEARQQRITLTRLIASLRLPEDLEAPDDVRRPQRRGAARGAYLREVS